MKLATGGPAGSTQKNLWVISATATDGGTGLPIPPEQIKIGDMGYLDTNGNLCVVLPDNDPPPVTPFVAGSNYYTYVVTGKKYNLTLATAYQALTDTNWFRTTLGVGEWVGCGFTDVPPTTLTWTVTAGGLTTNIGPLVRFTAPSNAANATVTVLASGANQSLTIPFKVVEPSAFDHAVVSNLFTYTSNTAGAGMHLIVYMKPTNVSFWRVWMEEVGEDATNVQGYFTNSPPITPAFLSHKASEGGTADKPFQIFPDNSWEHSGLNDGRDWDNADTVANAWQNSPSRWSSRPVINGLFSKKC